MDTDNQALLQEAKRLYNAREYAQAMPKLHALLERDPDNIIALMCTADILCEWKRWQESSLVAQRALDIAPKNPVVLSIMSKVLHYLSDFDGSLRYAKRVYKIAPQHPLVLKAYINALAHAEDSAAAVKIVPRVLALKDVEGDNGAAIALQAVGKTTESIRVWRTGIHRFLAQAAKKSPPPPTPKTDLSIDKSRQTLVAIKNMLDCLHVPFCLAHGTLLGIYRDGDMLPGDSDVDIMLPWSVKRDWLAKGLARMGCVCACHTRKLQKLEGQWCFSMRVPPHGLAVEMSFLKPENGKVWFGFARGQHVIRIPVSPFAFTTMRYLGEDFPIPAPADVHLRELYGENWNVRTRNRNFFVIHPELDDPGHIRIGYALNHILGGLITGDYKMAQGYTEQLLSVYDDPLLLQLREYFANLPFEITLFPPLPWQEKRLHYRDVVGQ